MKTLVIPVSYEALSFFVLPSQAAALDAKALTLAFPAPSPVPANGKPASPAVSKLNPQKLTT